LISSTYERIKTSFTTSFISFAQGSAKIYHDPESVQRICYVVTAAIQSISIYYNTSYLPEFVCTLECAQAFDFFKFLRIPNYLLHTYTARRIDANRLLNDLQLILPNYSQENLQTCLNTVLTDMLERGVDFRTEEQAQAFILNGILRNLNRSLPPEAQMRYEQLSSLHIYLKPKPKFLILADIPNISTDLLCIPAFLGSWSLIDLEQIASQLGTFSLLRWIPLLNLDSLIWGCMSMGFLMQFLESIRLLISEQTNATEKSEARLLFAVAGTEFLFCVTMLLKSDIRIKLASTLIAKSIGFISVFMTPEPSFF